MEFVADIAGSPVKMGLIGFADERFILSVKGVSFDELKGVEMEDDEDSIDEGEMDIDGSL